MGSCLDSLFSQTNVPAPEIIVVDNDSTDGTPQWIQAAFPSVMVIQQGTNDGYGSAANTGIQAARSDAVLVANPDTIFRDGSLAGLLEALAQYPRALINPKLLLPDDRINAVGNIMHVSGITSCNEYGTAQQRFHGILPISLLSGAAILASREVWTGLNGFDPDIFLYVEDAELSMRARLLGLELYCAADAEVVHDYALQLTPAKYQWLEQHRLWTVFKLYSWSTLFKMFPVLLLASGLTWLFAFVKGGPYVASRFRASVWVWRHAKRLLEAHREFGSIKQVSDHEIVKTLVPELPLSQLVAESRVIGRLSQLVTVVFRVLSPGGRAAS